MIFNPSFGGKALPILTNPGTAGDLLEGKQLIDQDGNPLTGTIPTKTSSDLTASGSSIIVPAGYYSAQASKSVATATQATPSISVSTNGLITASATQSAGYVAAGTKSATRQLTTQAGKTVTPSTSTQTAVSSGRYTTGTVYVAGDADLKAANIKSGVNIFGVAGTYDGPNIYMDNWSRVDLRYTEPNLTASFSSTNTLQLTLTLTNTPTGILAVVAELWNGYGFTPEFKMATAFCGYGFTDGDIRPDTDESVGAGGNKSGAVSSPTPVSIYRTGSTGKTLVLRFPLYSTWGASTISDVLIYKLGVMYTY